MPFKLTNSHCYNSQRWKIYDMRLTRDMPWHFGWHVCIPPVASLRGGSAKEARTSVGAPKIVGRQIWQQFFLKTHKQSQVLPFSELLTHRAQKVLHHCYSDHQMSGHSYLSPQVYPKYTHIPKDPFSLTSLPSRHLGWLFKKNFQLSVLHSIMYIAMHTDVRMSLVWIITEIY